MRINFGKILLFVAFLIVLNGCAVSHEQFSDIETHSRFGNYDGAIEALENNAQSLYDMDTDMILYNLDKGLLYHYNDDYAASNNELSSAETLIFNNYATSISEVVLSGAINDTMLTYQGEDFEDVYLNIFKALNYIHLNQYESAFVEIRRIDTKIKGLSIKYQAQIEEARVEFTELIGNSPDNNGVKLDFIDSAFARYLSMLMYRGHGELDSAKIDLNHIANAYNIQPTIYNFPLPSSLGEEINIPRGYGRLNFVVFTGFSAIKVAEEIMFPLGTTPIRLSFPTLENRQSIIGSVAAHIHDAESNELLHSLPLERIESVNAIVEDTFEQKQLLIYAKTVIRVVGKHIAAQVSEQAVTKSTDSLVGSIVGGLFKVFNVLSEQADLRISRFFPSDISVAGINLEPGNYNLIIEYFDANGNSIYKDMKNVIEIKAGNGLNLIESELLL